MPDETRMNATKNRLTDQVGRQAARKLKARRDGAPGVWSGLGMMGLVGWSVVVPTLLTSSEGVERLIETLEIHHLANRVALREQQRTDSFELFGGEVRAEAGNRFQLVECAARVA